MTEYVDRPLVLVVDDTPDNIQVLGGILRPEYEVKAALDGEKALKIARSEPKPDLILLDVMMPGMDGYQVCRRLKEDAILSDIPVIFVTAKDEVEDEKLGFELGAVDYITKPVSPPIVRARVRAHLALHAQNQELAKLAFKQQSKDEYPMVSAPDFDTAAVEQLLRELHVLLVNEIINANNVMKKLAPLLNGTEYAGHFGKISNAMEDFNLKETLEELERLASKLDIDL